MAIVGTLYKDMKLKPSILDEYVKDRALDQQLGEQLRQRAVCAAAAKCWWSWGLERCY